MRAEMATRNTADVSVELGSTTDFTLHKSQLYRLQDRVIDYTEHRLLRYALSVNDVQQRLVLMAMLADYKAGHIAIAWKRGLPVHMKVTRST